MQKIWVQGSRNVNSKDDHALFVVVGIGWGPWPHPSITDNALLLWYRTFYYLLSEGRLYFCQKDENRCTLLRVHFFKVLCSLRSEFHFFWINPVICWFFLVFLSFSSSFVFQTLITDCCFKKSKEVNAFLKVSCSLVFKQRNCFLTVDKRWAWILVRFFLYMVKMVVILVTWWEQTIK